MEIKTEIENIKECLAGYVGGVHAQASAAIEFLESELETLRAENAKFIAERDQYENHDVYATLYEDAKALIDTHTKASGGELPTSVIQSVEYLFKFWIQHKAEREAMMRQDPVAFISPSGDLRKSLKAYNADEFGEQFTPLYTSPPIVKVPDTLSSDDFVPMPSNADQASWMMTIGESWLERNAPERLNPHRVGLHIDDFAVNQFADSMKKKLAISREKGKSGWNDPLSCKVSYLAELLISHLPKGDPVDVANFAMMLHLRDGGHEALKEAANKIKQIPEGYALVPIEPSADVIHAIRRVKIQYGHDGEDNILYTEASWIEAAQLYGAMLSASQPKGESK
jgi:hypothetical protein